jgi:hypothetical protein
MGPKTYFYYCCQCAEGPKIWNYEIICLDCHHEACTDYLLDRRHLSMKQTERSLLTDIVSDEKRAILRLQDIPSQRLISITEGAQYDYWLLLYGVYGN